MKPSERSQLDKDLEEGRAARRERARAKVASGWTPKPTPKPTPKLKRVKANIPALLAETEKIAAECAADMDVQFEDAYHDVAQGMSMTIPNVDDRKAFLRGAGIMPSPTDPELADWDWLDSTDDFIV